MLDILRRALRLPRDERGASLVEYALLLALIALVCVGAISYFGGGTGGSLDRSERCLSAAYDGDTRPTDCD